MILPSEMAWLRRQRWTTASCGYSHRWHTVSWGHSADETQMTHRFLLVFLQMTHRFLQTILQLIHNYRTIQQKRSSESDDEERKSHHVTRTEEEASKSYGPYWIIVRIDCESPHQCRLKPIAQLTIHHTIAWYDEDLKSGHVSSKSQQWTSQVTLREMRLYEYKCVTIIWF